MEAAIKSTNLRSYLAYGGTYITLMKNCGFDLDTAKKIEANYHELYKESDDWVQSNLKQATVDGYITGAFGLKVRTPLLQQSIFTHLSTEAQAESRTAGNALGQSYGLLTNRAMNEFMDRVYDSKHKLDIKPVAMIHDATYFLAKNNPEVVKWLNDNLIDCMEWQELEEIKHDKVKLGAELEIYYPDWSNPIPVPNRASIQTITDILNNLPE